MASGTTKEPFVAGYKFLPNEVLLAAHREQPFTPLEMFVCTYEASLSNLTMCFKELTRIMCENPRGCLLAVNSNFGHACQPGFEEYLKTPKPVVEQPYPSRTRVRKMQGDGTCFNSAVEAVIQISHPGIKAGKVYSVKCFPSTGETQVPGSVIADRSDARLVLREFTAYLNQLNLGPQRIEVLREGPTMINFKFRLNRSCPRILVNHRALADYFSMLERTKLVAGNSSTAEEVLPPYLVREMKSAQDDVKVSFGMRVDTRVPRINVFQEGKVNILGALTDESAVKIHAFFVELFTRNWDKLVTLQPKCDVEVRKSAKTAATISAGPPPTVGDPSPPADACRPPANASPPLTDSDIAALLGDEPMFVDEPATSSAPVRDILAALNEFDDWTM